MELIPVQRDTSTNRLSLETLTVAHAIELFEPFLHEAMYQFIPDRMPASLEALQREFRSFENGPPPDSVETALNWVIRERASQRCIGTLQATLFKDDTLWIGYKLAPGAWGRGVGTEAVTWLVEWLGERFGHREILASVDTRHGASVRLLERVGFTLVRVEPAELHGEPTQDFVYVHRPAARPA